MTPAYCARVLFRQIVYRVKTHPQTQPRMCWSTDIFEEGAALTTAVRMVLRTRMLAVGSVLIVLPANLARTSTPTAQSFLTKHVRFAHTVRRSNRMLTKKRVTM